MDQLHDGQPAATHYFVREWMVDHAVEGWLAAPVGELVPKGENAAVIESRGRRLLVMTIHGVMVVPRDELQEIPF